MKEGLTKYQLTVIKKLAKLMKEQLNLMGCSSVRLEMEKDEDMDNWMLLLEKGSNMIFWKKPTTETGAVLIE